MKWTSPLAPSAAVQKEPGETVAEVCLSLTKEILPSCSRLFLNSVSRMSAGEVTQPIKSDLTASLRLELPKISIS